MKLYHRSYEIFVIQNIKTRKVQIVSVDRNETFKYQKNIPMHYLFLMSLGMEEDTFDTFYEYNFMYTVQMYNKKN